MLMKRDFYETLFCRINKMNKNTINTEYKCNSTIVSNIFIDQYMPEASGSFVKVYLYLLRCLSDNTKPFSLSTATKDLDETEKNILRALSYWENNNVLSLSIENNTLTGITLLELKEEKEKLLESVNSFLNSDSGGQFFFGIKDITKDISGIDSLLKGERVKMVLGRKS